MWSCLQPQLSHSLFRCNFNKSSKAYKSVGEFDYGQPNCIKDRIKLWINRNPIQKSVYIGEVEEDTYAHHGIGIEVSIYGDIREGYWKNRKLHGRGRTFYSSGEYYIGEYIEDRRQGQGIAYIPDEEKYRGWGIESI